MLANVANSLTLNAHSYLVGDRAVYRLKVSLSVPLDCITNVSLDCFRIERMRNQFAFGFGTAPRVVAGMLEVEQSFPIDFKTGLYGISEATLSIRSSDESGEPSGTASQNIRVTFSPVFFEVRTAIEQPALPETIAQQATATIKRRVQLVSKPHIISDLAAAHKQPSFLIFVFGVGCLLHQMQQHEGFAITPLGRGLSHRNMSEVVNQFLQGNGLKPLPFIDTTEQAFAASTRSL